MRVTEQIDAMEVSGTRPLSYVVASRVMATTIVVPVLARLGDIFGHRRVLIGCDGRGHRRGGLDLLHRAAHQGEGGDKGKDQLCTHVRNAT